MDVLQSTEHFFMNVLPVATPIVVAWLGYKMPKKTKEQTDQIISELNDVKGKIKDVQETGCALIVIFAGQSVVVLLPKMSSM